ncbi:CHRD domain-containing protein [Streptomyces sp. NPDC002889]|uniref:CHRD domain-containing protein n=1 Tax=Streptomyces sp. NPDC002889 TaxID=3364669 RepID=UPI0036D2031C
MQKRSLAVPAAAIVLATTGMAPALAHDNASHTSPTNQTAQADHESRAGHMGQAGQAGMPSHKSKARAVTFAAVLTGAHEVAVEGGPAVNDPDGKAVALVKVKGDRVVFSMQWKGFLPNAGHIHEGAAGQNGDIKVPLFGTAMPDTIHSAAGQTVLTDAKLADSLRDNASGFYVNLHSEEFPGGAVRGQLRRLHKNVNPLDIIQGGKLRALANGDQEVPVEDAHKVGDDDGHAITFLHPKGRNVDFSLAWVNIQAPQAAHIHKGGFGKNGDVVLGLLNKPVPEGLFAVSGRLEDQHKGLLKEIRHSPESFYSNIHTKKFPDGAVRGQLFD